MTNACSFSQTEQLFQRIAQLEEQVRLLKEQLILATRRAFGRAAETFPADQLALFSTADAEIVALPDPADSASNSTNHKPSQRTLRQAVVISKDTPVERIELDVDENDKVCPCCQGALHRIGEDCTRQVEFVPPQTRVIETVRPKYACRTCETGVNQAALPPSIIPKSMATPSLLAFLIVSKFLDHLPLNRIQTMLARVGIILPRSTQCDWLMACAEHLRRLVILMKQDLLRSPQLFTDDTILPLQNDDKKRNSLIQSRLWVYATQSRTGPPIVIYDFTRTRSKQGPLTFLQDYRGYLQADAYGGYDALYRQGAKEVGCMAHCRRKFFEAAEQEETPGQAHQALIHIGRLYKLEQEIKHYNDKKRKKYRRVFAKPLLRQFKRWLEALQRQHLPKGKFAKAVNYALNNWPALIRYCEAGYLEIDNNTGERQMRPVALGRKNYLFTGSERGGEAAAMLYSIAETAKRNGLNEYDYITDVLRRLPTASESELKKLLPYHWKTDNKR